MARSNVYMLAVIAPDGKPALTWPAGHPIEVALTEEIVSALVHRITEPIATATVPGTIEQGVGFFKTEATVAQAVDAAVRAAIASPAVTQAVRQAITDAILNLKRQVRPGRTPVMDVTASESHD